MENNHCKEVCLFRGIFWQAWKLRSYLCYFSSKSVCVRVQVCVYMDVISSYSLDYVFLTVYMCSFKKEGDGNPFVKTVHAVKRTLMFFTFTLSIAPICFDWTYLNLKTPVPCDFSSRHMKAGTCQEHLDVCVAFTSSVKYSGESRGQLI